jgi:diguanylate cyclase (GGDEF)-like protein
MKSLFAYRNQRLADLSESERRRFHAFTFARLRHSLTLLTFSMPLLFAVGWARDYAVLGETARVTLLVRLFLIVALLVLASTLRRCGFNRMGEIVGVLYAFVFGLAIAMLTALEPAKLSLTHVAVMLITIILLPYAMRRSTAIGVVAGLCLPLFGLLVYLGAPLGLWVAYVLFCIAGVIVGAVQRSANLHSTLDIFMYRQRLLRRLHIDSLTGVSNRDGWEAKAAQLYRTHTTSGQPLSIVFFDLDRFKQINDVHGHATGDDVLQRVSRTMAQCLRADDVVARVGGEEFVALLANSDLENAFRVAERIRRAIEGIDDPVRTTVSAGVAQVRPPETLEAATQRADNALLQAKQSGRNRTVRA